MAQEIGKLISSLPDASPVDPNNDVFAIGRGNASYSHSINHASADPAFGLGTSTQYGHVRVQDGPKALSAQSGQEYDAVSQLYANTILRNIVGDDIYFETDIDFCYAAREYDAGEYLILSADATGIGDYYRSGQLYQTIRHVIEGAVFDPKPSSATWNVRKVSLTSQLTELNNNCNSSYAGKDITKYIQDGSIFQRMQGTDGYLPFDDIYPGDYIRIIDPSKQNFILDGADGIGTNTFAVAHRLYKDFRGRDKHCMIMIPIQDPLNEVPTAPSVGTGIMNAKQGGVDTTAGGYMGSDMRSLLNNNGNYQNEVSLYHQICAKLPWNDGGITPNAHIQNLEGIKFSIDVDSTVPNRTGGHALGASRRNGEERYGGAYFALMSEINVFGNVVFSSSGYDYNGLGFQFEIFKNNIMAAHPGSNPYWLRDVAAIDSFTGIAGDGTVTSSVPCGTFNVASSTAHIRPFFVLSTQVDNTPLSF